jgi:hypothetical protein
MKRGQTTIAGVAMREMSMIEAGYGRRMNRFGKSGERFAVTQPKNGGGTEA